MLVLTMAGRASRFRDEGILIPKYMVHVHGRCLLQWALFSTEHLWRAGEKVVFVCLRENADADVIEQMASCAGVNEFDIVELDRMTAGQASTVLEGLARTDVDSSRLIVFNIDTLVNPDCLLAVVNNENLFLPCFPGQGTHWSFAKFGADGNLVDVREKERISQHATIGLYMFPSVAVFESIFNVEYPNPPTASETYVAPLLKHLEPAGYSTSGLHLKINDVVPLGTPSETRAFENSVLATWAQR